MVRERSFWLKLLLAFIMSVQISGDRKPNWKWLKKNLKRVDSHSWKVNGAQMDSGARVDGVIRNHSSDWFLSPACLLCFQVSSHLMGTKRLSEALSFHSTPPSPVGNRILLSCRLGIPQSPRAHSDQAETIHLQDSEFHTLFFYCLFGHSLTCSSVSCLPVAWSPGHYLCRTRFYKLEWNMSQDTCPQTQLMYPQEPGWDLLILNSELLWLFSPSWHLQFITRNCECLLLAYLHFYHFWKVRDLVQFPTLPVLVSPRMYCLPRHGLNHAHPKTRLIYQQTPIWNLKVTLKHF